MKALGISAVNDDVSLALLSDNCIYEIAVPTNKSNRLYEIILHIEKLLFSKNIKLSDLSFIAIYRGPGSYTGLRLSMSIAKAMAYSNKLKIITISTLMTLAQFHKENFNYHNYYILPLMYARKNYLYCGIYQSVLSNNIVEEICKENFINIENYNSIFDIEYIKEFLSFAKNSIFSSQNKKPFACCVSDNPNLIFNNNLLPQMPNKHTDILDPSIYVAKLSAQNMLKIAIDLYINDKALIYDAATAVINYNDDNFV